MTLTRRTTDTLIILGAILLSWQVLHQYVGETALPSPLPTLSYLVRFVTTARFLDNALATLICFAYALALSYALGLAIGVWMGSHHLSGAVGEPILISLYTLPKITLYPVVLLIFGLAMSGRVTFGAMHGVLPVALLTMGAIRNIRPVSQGRAPCTCQDADGVHRAVPATLPGWCPLRIGSRSRCSACCWPRCSRPRRADYLIVNAMQLVQNEMITSRWCCSRLPRWPMRCCCGSSGDLPPGLTGR
jgi:NitT/TauT family transport system permease protein